MLLVACKPGTPSQYIQPGEMEDILVDYYEARALAQHDGSIPPQEREYNTALYIEAVLKKHGVTQAEFDSSLVYYYTRADRFVEIFQRVTERLDEKALTMGASEGEIGKYAQYNATGDTANIWVDRSRALLVPAPPYNRWEFSIDCDSSYRRGDALMMQFTSDYMYQTGTKGGVLYMAVDYGDTVVGKNIHFSVAGISQLRIPADTTRRMSAIKGFFYLDGGNEVTTTTRLLFLNNVQLIRFHTRPAEYEPKDSIARDSVAGRLDPDTLRGGALRGQGDTLVPAGAGAAADGVAARADSAKTR